MREPDSKKVTSRNAWERYPEQGIKNKAGGSDRIRGTDTLFAHELTAGGREK